MKLKKKAFKISWQQIYNLLNLYLLISIYILEYISHFKLNNKK